MSNTIPLPEPVTLYHRPSFLAGEYIYITGYTADQMREYAAAVSAADNAALKATVLQLRAARWAYANEFPLDSDGEPDVGNIHANIRAMKKRIKLLEVDAGRWRYLRDGDWEWMDDTWMRIHKLDGIGTADVKEAQLDAAIDAARAALGDKTPTTLPPSPSPRS